jgi:hypothetical protein
VNRDAGTTRCNDGFCECDPDGGAVGHRLHSTATLNLTFGCRRPKLHCNQTNTLSSQLSMTVILNLVGSERSMMLALLQVAWLMLPQIYQCLKYVLLHQHIWKEQPAHQLTC